MLRGMYVYKCNQCGHKFIGADIEDRATVYSMSVHCSRCGSTNTEKGLMDTLRSFLKGKQIKLVRIWQTIIVSIDRYNSNIAT